MLAFSTCWNSHRHSEGEAMVDELLALGFDTIEISHGLKVSLLPGLQKAFAEGRMKKKVLGATEAIAAGVEQVIFGDARRARPIWNSMNGEGTVIHR